MAFQLKRICWVWCSDGSGALTECEMRTRARLLVAVFTQMACFVWKNRLSSLAKETNCLVHAMQHTRSIFAMLFYFRSLCIVLLCPNFCIILLLIVSFPPMWIDCCSFLCLAPLDVFYSQNFSNVVVWFTNAYSPPLCTKPWDKTLLN